MISLDDLDRRLLDLLQRDAGRTLHDLGEEVGLSPSAVQRRIGRYRASGLIERQVAVLDPAVAGGLTAIVLVTLEHESAEHHAGFAGRMLATPEVQQCYAVAGEWDYAVVLVVADMPHCRLLGDRLFKNDANIRRFNTLPVFERIKSGMEIPVATWKGVDP
ncbi:Lrp/AsnC family transcriptional regulator [Spirillospora sp. CA-294931]|uniref:Lrp/AsnC family transcriptional regulator n=1 Tax=Spirillospora sp. CA-294931 TaxID=3240042 RepID=UPI003D89DD0A